MEIKTIVEYKGRRGVVVDDLYSCCSEDETPVVFTGTASFKGTPTAELTIIGPEEAIPEPVKCGAGKGDDCCIFLVCGTGGFECQRFGDLRYQLIFTNMTAKRHPLKMFPECYLTAEK